jgi:hypothetical protein
VVSVIRWKSVATAVIATLVLACGSSNDDSAAARCDRVREHLIDLSLSSHDATDDERARRAGVIRRAMGNEFLASCARSMDEARTDCILAAADSKSAAACAQPNSK